MLGEYYRRKIKQVYRQEGWRGVFKRTLVKLSFYHLLRRIYQRLRSSLVYVYLRLRKKRKPTFIFRGKEYLNFWHPYNATWRNERAVEVPIFLELLAKNRGKRILEVGNVLSHYKKVSYDILDKYERARGVINEDVVLFRPKTKYDLIISISTLEHVGWDEEVRASHKILRAINNFKTNCLALDGRIVFSVPLGYNPPLDELIRRGELPLKHKYYLKRVSAENQWAEVVEAEAVGARYGFPFPAANVVLVGEVVGRGFYFEKMR